MSQNKSLQSIERKIFKSYFEDGLLDIFLAAFVLMFAIAPLLSETLGDFWSSFIFLPFFGVVYLILWYLRRRLIVPRIGSVRWGELRKKKLRTGSIIMLVINLIFLILGVVTYLTPLASGLIMSIRFGVMMLILFSSAAYMLDFNFLYVYGILIALALPVGEWLYQNAGFSHHGFPVVFGSLAAFMFVRGVYKFIRLVITTPLQNEEQTLSEYNHG